MADGRRLLGTFAVWSLVLLRLAIGWHFYQQGTEKVAYDAEAGWFRVDFSAEPFLAQATGPLAGWYHAQVSNVHDWPTLLAVERENRPLAGDQRAQARTEENGQSGLVEFPPSAPYYDWARRIADDWAAHVAELKAVPAFAEEQQAAADDALRMRLQQLADYLAGEADAIVEYQHDLWRLEKLRSAPEADGVPFYQQRTAAKEAETTRSAYRWINEVRRFEEQFREDLYGILSDKQRASAATMSAVDAAVVDPRQKRLETISAAAAILIITVGICLLLGFFTRLASFAGALFLLAVIASQPPWVPGAASTIEQTVELAGMLVLAGTGAGRWFGLDFFTYALFGKCCRRD